MIKLMVKACGLVQQSNEDATKPKFSRNHVSCKLKRQYLFVEDEGWEESRNPGPQTSRVALGIS